MKTIKINSKNIFSKLFLLMMILMLSQKSYSQTWSTLGSGMDDWVYASAIYNGDLIVGGKFTAAGGVNADHIARWDGTTPVWLSL
ncbi:MAG: hypothetical protein IPO27_11255 [Bacteroidetes bacterium]|nr:hypothetical protein [Bacteroidota bacterium]